MKRNHKVEIVDITRNRRFENYLYRCLSAKHPMPFMKYPKRNEYLMSALKKGFHKKLVVFDGEIVGQVEYAPTEVSGYPIVGSGVVVMNCIWVLRKAKGHNLGTELLSSMMKSEKKAAGFATIGLENHWSPWMKKEQMEKLGFRSISFVKVRQKTKHADQCFKMHLMWLPAIKNARPPSWDKKRLLEGVDFCMSHPLYRPQKTRVKSLFEIC